MARTGITYEQVEQAANSLVASGKNPTIAAVRETLGTGSAGTIHRFLTQYREAAPVVHKQARDVPEGLQAALVAEIDRAAAGARAEVEEKLIETRQEADTLSADLEAMEAERDGLAEQVAALTTERDTLAGKAAQQAADLADQAQRIEREQQAAESARVELATARLKIEAHDEKQKELTAEIERLRAELFQATEGLHAARQEAAVLAAKLGAATDRAERAEARADRIERVAEKDIQAHESARAASVQELRKAQDERDDARQDAAEARAQAAEFKGELKAMRATLEKLEKALAGQVKEKMYLASIGLE